MHLKESPFKTVGEAFFYYDLVHRRVDTSNQVIVKNWAILKLEQTLREVAEKKKRTNINF